VELTGMHSCSTGALSNEHIEVALPSDIPLVTDLLSQAGYDVAICGKVHFQRGAEDRYCDYYFGHNSPGNNYANPLFKEGRKGHIGVERQFHDIYPDDLATDRAIQWLGEDRGNKPFCLLLWFVAPHEPFFRARRHLDLYRGVTTSVPESFNDDLRGYPGKPGCFIEAKNKIGTTYSHPACSSLESIVKNYYSGLVAMDENIGRVLSHLETKQQLDDTAIIHTSDHGYFLGEWRMFDKRLMHEPSIRVPLMIRYPGRIPAGTLRTEMVLDTDLAPSFLDLAGVPIPRHMQGKSLLPLATERDPEFRKEWYYEYYEWPNPEGVPPCRGIRTERYKLIQYTLVPEREMYDLACDPQENVNLYGKSEYATLQKSLEERLDALRASLPVRDAL
jgi:arylsulfatase A-like enzyme